VTVNVHAKSKTIFTVIMQLNDNEQYQTHLM